MAEVAVTPRPLSEPTAPRGAVAAPPSPATPAGGQLDIEGTSHDFGLKLPERPAGDIDPDKIVREKLGDQSAARASTLLEEVAGLHQLADANSHFLSRSEFGSASAAIVEVNKAMLAALNAGDAEKYLRELTAIKEYLERISKFVDYERSQGLVGTCTDSGVRIYMKNNRIWLCTPDREAFNSADPAAKQALVSFVRGITGIDPIKLEEAIFQFQIKEGDLELLGCRLDQLRLKQLAAGEKYRIDTMVKTEGGEYQYSRVEFTWADIQQGKVPGVIGQDAALPSPLAGQSVKASALGPGNEIRDRDLRTVGPALIGSAFRMGTPAMRAATAAESLRAAARVAEVLQKTDDALRARFAQRSAIAATKDYARAGQFLDELVKTQPAYEDAVKARRQALEADIRKAVGNSREYRHAVQELRTLISRHAHDVLLRKTLLEHQAANGDDAVKAGANTRLTAMADEVDAAYAHQLRQPNLSDQSRKTLETNRAEFKAKYSPPPPARFGAVGRLLSRLSERVWSIGSARIGLPGAQTFKRIVDARALARALQYVDALPAVSPPLTLAGAAADVSGISATEQKVLLTKLEKQANQVKAQIKALDQKLLEGNASVAADLNKLKEGDARLSIRRAALLEEKLKAAQNPAAQIEAKSALAKIAAEAEDAYRFLGDDAAADHFARLRGAEKTEVGRAERLAAARGNPAVDAAVRSIRKINDALGKAAAGTPQHAELTAARTAAERSADVALADLDCQRCEERALDSADANAEQDLRDARDKLAQARRNRYAARVAHAEAQVNTVTQRLTEIDNELTGNPPDRVKAALEKEKRALAVREAELKSEVVRVKTAGVAGPLRGEISQLKEEVEKAERAAAAETDPAVAKAKITEAARLKSRLLSKDLALIKAELEGTQNAKTVLESNVRELTQKADDFQAAGNASEAKKCRKEVARLERRLKKLETVNEYLTEQQNLALKERGVHILENKQRTAAAKLETARSAAGTDPNNLAALEQKLQSVETELSTARTELTQQQKQFRGGWGRRLSAAVRSFDTKLAQLEAMAMRNPLKTATIVGAVGEGLRAMTSADYSENGRHHCLPSLICLLDGDLDDEFFGFDVSMTTTELGGEGPARLVELMSGGGNVAIVMGGVRAAPFVYGNTFGRLPGGQAAGAKVGQFLAQRSVGRVLGFGGAALDGYLSFADGSFMNATDEQLFSKTASPIVIGAAFGSFFGPPGAVIGAFGGAVGELGGLAHACVKLDEQIDRDWRKRGVRESVRLGMKGYLYPDGDPALLGHSRVLSDWEEEALNDLAKSRLLQRMFRENGDFSRDELQAMGFRLDNSAEAGQHNFERLGELWENPQYRWIWNPFRENNEEVVWSNHSYDLFHGAHGHLAQRLHTLKNEEYNNCFDLYLKAPRVTYRDQRTTSTLGLVFSNPKELGKVDQTSELNDYFKSRAGACKEELEKRKAEFAADGMELSKGDEAELMWRVIAEPKRGFAHLDRILADTSTRQEFFSRFMSATGIDLENSALWKHKLQCETGIKFVQWAMPEELRSMVRGGLREPLEDINRWAVEMKGEEVEISDW